MRIISSKYWETRQETDDAKGNGNLETCKECTYKSPCPANNMDTRVFKSIHCVFHMISNLTISAYQRMLLTGGPIPA